MKLRLLDGRLWVEVSPLQRGRPAGNAGDPAVKCGVAYGRTHHTIAALHPDEARTFAAMLLECAERADKQSP